MMLVTCVVSVLCCAAGIVSEFAADRFVSQDPVPPKRVKHFVDCRGCRLVRVNGDGYRMGFRLRMQAGFENAAHVLSMGSIGRSGVCTEIGGHCIDAPCSVSEIALVRNTSGSKIWIRVGPDYVVTPFMPRPDKDGWLAIAPGSIGIYRSYTHALFCNDLPFYRRVDVRDAKRGKLIASLEWSAKCSRCRELTRLR